MKAALIGIAITIGWTAVAYLAWIALVWIAEAAALARARRNRIQEIEDFANRSGTSQSFHVERDKL